MSVPFELTSYADQLAEIARWTYRCGWAPGTSTNYSVRLPADAAPAYCAITSSGIDKERLGAEHILAVDSTGRAVGGSPLTPSAETALHLMLYRSTHAGAVFHTHSMAATLLSQAAREEGRVSLSGWELLKGLEGITSHEHEVVLPVFPNSQNIPALASMIEPLLTTSSSPPYGFLLAGHGLYVWGKDVGTAKRHLEVLEYLLQCEREARSHGHSSHTRPAGVPHE
ncbi:methylthioribulose-1-phosphate dehydratase [Nitrospira sp. KM1]|uniref:methylthioribulose 1-phosphate dehydratase n=1 Tax=Nitrospira sp. KM1 TaxID=1936990 RepID=UPI0013A71329|nr:methylthioribulose 1-phosphate dehydratase [Nitrospira sp. KM1]BCA56294.1 methylthioribulose-1-phosphate dehydratase [Nitrospira sp. KM1]